MQSVASGIRRRAGCTAPPAAAYRVSVPAPNGERTSRPRRHENSKTGGGHPDLERLSTGTVPAASCCMLELKLASRAAQVGRQQTGTAPKASVLACHNGTSS